MTQEALPTSALDADLEPTTTPEPRASAPDLGPPLPELPPQPRVRVMVRDPETSFVYWEGKEQPGGWEVVAEDRSGQAAVTRASAATSAYVEAPVADLDRVLIRPVGEPSAARSAELPWSAGSPAPQAPEQGADRGLFPRPSSPYSVPG